MIPGDRNAGIQTGGKFSVVPARAFADRRLKPIDLVVLGVLGITQSRDGVRRREGGFEISQAAIAALSGIARPTVNKAVKRLREAGYLLQRVQVTATGTRAPNLYYLVYDAELPAAHDRWSPVVGADGVIDVPDLPPLPCLVTPSVPLANSGVRHGNTTVTGMHVSAASRGIPTVPHGDTMVLVGDRAVSHGHPSPNNGGFANVPKTDSGDVESTHYIQELIESIRAPSAAETVVNAFLKLRRTFYPGVEKRPSAREKLLAQAQECLDLGGTVETIVATLAKRIGASPDEGLEAPSGISRYRHDLRRAVTRQEVGFTSPRRTRAVPPSKPPDDAPWRELKSRVADRVGQDRVRTWLDQLAFIGVRGGVLRLGAPTATIRKFALEVLAEGLVDGSRVEIAVGVVSSLPRES